MRRQTKLKGTNEVIISEKSHDRKYRKEIFTKVERSMYSSRSVLDLFLGAFKILRGNRLGVYVSYVKQLF